ncbi:trypsin-like peptidase domain-containing protein [Streptomyces sp. NPDC058746]|uniref:trypsin-like peptidase domain-containing protein n=1 Tax=Streptomyces sp. NPDC058746 TaxID=3346622 RepID=UPI0036B4F9AC
MVLRTLTMAAAAAALLVSGGPLPSAAAGNAAVPEAFAAGRWSAREAESFWTPARMASAVPLPAGPVPDAPATPGAAPASTPGTGAGPGSPAPVPAPQQAAPGATPGAAPPLALTPAADAEVPPVPDVDPLPDPLPDVDADADDEGLTTPPVLEPASPRLPAPGPGVGQDFNGMPSVGRMYLVKGGGAYFCTASVVASAGHDLVMSAAHCLTGSDYQQVAFVPQYTRTNPQPYGMFPVRRTAAGKSRIWIDPRYRSQGVDRAARLDVAFAQVGPDADGVPVEDVVGGNRLLTGAGYAHPKVSLVGYPASAARPRLCVNRTTKFTSSDPGIPGSFLRIDCTGYPGGTSGGPFLSRYDARTGTGDVVGVIGGWKTGGDTADTSYSSYFGTDVRKLYEKAVAEAKAA